MHSLAKRISVPVVPAVLCALSIMTFGAETATPTRAFSYEVTYDAFGEDRLSIPFVLEGVAKGKRVFWSDFYGVNVDSVSADGRKIPSEPYSLPLSEYSSRTRNADGAVVYLLTTWTSRSGHEKDMVWNLVSIRDYDGRTGDRRSIVHRIPKSTKRIEITYRIRFGDGQLGKPCLAVLLMEPPDVEDGATPSANKAER